MGGKLSKGSSNTEAQPSKRNNKIMPEPTKADVLPPVKLFCGETASSRPINIRGDSDSSLRSTHSTHSNTSPGSQATSLSESPNSTNGNDKNNYRRKPAQLSHYQTAFYICAYATIFPKHFKTWLEHRASKNDRLHCEQIFSNFLGFLYDEDLVLRKKFIEAARKTFLNSPRDYSHLEDFLQKNPACRVLNMFNTKAQNVVTSFLANISINDYRNIFLFCFCNELWSDHFNAWAQAEEPEMDKIGYCQKINNHFIDPATREVDEKLKAKFLELGKDYFFNDPSKEGVQEHFYELGNGYFSGVLDEATALTERQQKAKEGLNDFFNSHPEIRHLLLLNDQEMARSMLISFYEFMDSPKHYHHHEKGKHIFFWDQKEQGEKNTVSADDEKLLLDAATTFEQ